MGHKPGLCHIVVLSPSIDGDRTLAFDAACLNELGCARTVTAILPSFTLLPLFVAGTSNIATLPGRLARLYAGRLALGVIAPAIDFPVVSEHLQWHIATAKTIPPTNGCGTSLERSRRPSKPAPG